ncbi:MAG: tRNA (N(6)-L-threonylcarbamoyladenosine(37)-C(2))-methylthiotransferase MtaB [Candidatus Hydrogenedentes bacterium]|nr:tRNA (N(6)-L-threonylcarbamoyladenosine(37)-C(2))-methylthiotransferase MtaB [Candidatus Hydrogenedentota bacterium]
MRNGLTQHSCEAKRASVHTLGCRLNQSESSLIAEQLEAAGYEVVPFGQNADLGIINTCTVTGEADSKSRQLVRSFIRKNPHAYTAVIGCYSQMGYRTLAEIEGVDLIVGNQEKLNVLDYVAAGKNDTPLVVRDRIDRDDFTIEITGDAPLTRRANLKIQDGCDFMCSFCIIPFARGRARSRSMDNLIQEARSLAERGAKEIVLTGVNVGTYAYEEATIVDVVEWLNEIEGVERIRISSIEPTTIPENLFELMNRDDHALVPYLHVPLQSGSNKVLHLMKRRYSREAYLDFIWHAHRSVPGLCLGTDILVGTPGEGESEFEETLRLLEESPLAYAHVFKYSERPGTAASRYPDKVDTATQNRRSARIRRASDVKRRGFYEARLGQSVEVLFEHEENGYWTGYTGNYIRVAVRSSEQLENEVRSVTLERLAGDYALGSLEQPALVAS